MDTYRDGNDEGASLASDTRLSALYERVDEALDELAAYMLPGFVESDLPAVHEALERIASDNLARGPVFCEWGCGHGAVTALASLMDFEAYGIEIDATLIASARALVSDLDIDAEFVVGTVLLPGDEDLARSAQHMDPSTSTASYQALGLDLATCDVVFAYPWPGDEHVFDALFLRHTTPGALLITYHGSTHVLVQRHSATSELDTVVRA